MEQQSAEYICEQALAAAGTVQRNLQQFQTALPPGWSVADTEKAAATRRRFTGHFKTNRLDSWILYVTQTLKSAGQHLVNPQAFVASSNMAATAVFDLGTPDAPGHAEWRATYQAQVTAGYAALLAITQGRPVDQQTLVDFFSDWAPNLVFADAAQTPALVINAVRQVQVARERKVDAQIANLASSGSVMDSVAARSTAGELPESFGFTVEPYEGFQQRTIGVQLRLAPGADRPLLYLRTDQKDALVESIENEFVGILNTGVAEALPLYLGSFA